MFRSSPAARNEILRSIYFDTQVGDLRKEGVALRIRKRGRAAPLLGVKARSVTTDGPFSRSEIEVRSRSLEPDLALFDQATAADLDRLIDKRPLKAQFETQIRRRVVLIDWGRSQIEVACDEGTIVADTQRVPLAEVELELKAGEEHDLYDLAMKLAEEFSLKLDFVSKAEQGFRLTAPETPSAMKALTIEYGTDALLDDAVVAVISNALAQFIGNWAVLRTSDQPEAIHQMRVALRRLRAALAIFKRALPCPEFDVLRSEARRIATALGPARECDVFHSSATQGPLAHPDRPANCEMLLASVAERRFMAYRDARALIDDTATTQFVLKIRSFLARRTWRNVLVGPDLALLTFPPVAFACETLDRLRVRALKRGKNLSDLSDEARHELRIALKKLRYAAEFFATLFGGRRAIRRYVATVSDLQDVLGAHNDVVSARQFLDALPTELERTSGFIIGWHARGTAIADAKLLDMWKTFRKVEPFWR